MSQHQRQPLQVASTLMRWRQSTLSRRRAAKRLAVARDDETMEQEGPESKRQRTVAGLPVCSLLPPVDEIPVSCVATHEIDERDQLMTIRRVNGWLHIW